MLATWTVFSETPGFARVFLSSHRTDTAAKRRAAALRKMCEASPTRVFDHATGKWTTRVPSFGIMKV